MHKVKWESKTTPLSRNPPNGGNAGTEAVPQR